MAFVDGAIQGQTTVWVGLLTGTHEVNATDSHHDRKRSKPHRVKVVYIDSHQAGIFLGSRKAVNFLYDAHGGICFSNHQSFI